MPCSLNLLAALCSAVEVLADHFNSLNARIATKALGDLSAARVLDNTLVNNTLAQMHAVWAVMRMEISHRLMS